MKNNVNKVLAVALAVTLLALAVVAGTLAYLTKETAAIKNVFTKGEGVDIDLKENGDVIDTYEAITDAEEALLYYQNDYTYTPGNYAEKTVEVENTGAADCYVFIMVEMGADFDTYASVLVDEDNWVLVETENASNEGKERTQVYAYVGETGEIASLTAGDTTAPLFVDQDGSNAGTEVKYLNKTTADLANWTGLTDVSLKFTAFAIQTSGWDNPTADSVWTNFWAG